jgi:hypothetical protein
LRPYTKTSEFTAEVEMCATRLAGRCRLTPFRHRVDRARCHGLKLKCDKPLSKYSVKSNLRRYSLATLMASLHEFPTIRYKSDRAPDGTGTPAVGGAAAVATKVHRMMLSMQGKPSSSIPERASCDLLILDRGVDAIAPVIHEVALGTFCPPRHMKSGLCFRFRI